jgi:acetylornithine deacetylase/succinyl-diaminopimelate desuccinylase-like protein
VVELSAEDRKKIAARHLMMKEYNEELDVKALAGEAGYTALEQLGIRPTLDATAFGEVIPEKVLKPYCHQKHAKISMRLVPNQNSKEITKLFVDHFQAIAPPQVKVQVIPHHGGEPAVTPINSVAFTRQQKMPILKVGAKCQFLPEMGEAFQLWRYLKENLA